MGTQKTRKTPGYATQKVKASRATPKQDAQPSGKNKRPAARSKVGRNPVRATGSAARPEVTPKLWRAFEERFEQLTASSPSTDDRAIAAAIFTGVDTLALCPDDFGHTAAYEASAVLLSAPTLVVSVQPRALQEQYSQLQRKRVPALFYHAQLRASERRAAIAQVSTGGPLLVLATAESLLDNELRRALTKSGLAQLVIEQAHAASEFAHEFRPVYEHVAEFRRGLGAAPVLALTAAANESTRKDVACKLGLSLGPGSLGSAPDSAYERGDDNCPFALPLRDNLKLQTQSCGGSERQRRLLEVLSTLPRPGVVYCPTPHEADAVYAVLQANHIPAHRFHSGMSAAERAAELLKFAVPGRRSVMVATSALLPSSGLVGLFDGIHLDDAPTAFGLGLHKRDLRFIVHYQAPPSLEQLLQEVHGAGRDGQPATCVLLFDGADQALNDTLLHQARPRPEHLMRVREAIERASGQNQILTTEALALGTGQSRRAVEQFIRLLADANLVESTSGWVKLRVSVEELNRSGKRLEHQLDQVRSRDLIRMRAVQRYAETTECKARFLADYMGTRFEEACGRCSVCKPDLPSKSVRQSSTPVPRRRMVAREFKVEGKAPAEHDDEAQRARAERLAKLAAFSG